MDYSKFEIASKLNAKYSEFLLRNKLHFRGNFEAYSFISLDQITPELGIAKQLKTIEQGIAEINKIKLKTKKGKGKFVAPPSRTTPEKMFQAHLIYGAIKNGGMLPLPAPYSNIKFVTSELLVPFNKIGIKNRIGDRQLRNTKQIITDILGINEENELVVIELKSDRQRKTLERQVGDFKAIVENRMDVFRGIVRTILGVEVTDAVRGMVIWPKGGDSKSKQYTKCLSGVDYLFEYEVKYIVNEVK